MPIPDLIASLVDQPATSRPFTSTFPESGFISPPRIRIRVDLPAPFSPTSAWISPGKTSRDAPRFARMGPKSLVISAMRMAGWGMGDEGWGDVLGDLNR